MCWRLDLWSRFRTAGFWWMHAMLGVWFLFAVMLFVAEPLIAHHHFRGWATLHRAAAFAWVSRIHWLLLILSALTIVGAVAGSRGWPIS